MKRNTPPITQDLLDYLTEMFPDRLPRNPVDETELARLIGKQDVIRKLQDEYDKYTLT